MSKNQPTTHITPLQSLIDRYSFLSYRKIETLCAYAPNCSKSMIEKLAKNQIEDADTASSIRKVLAAKLPHFLLSQGLNASTIDAELSAIFKEGEYKKMISARTTLNKNVQRFFGFSNDPFALIPRSSEEIFVSRDLQAIFDRVIEAMKYQHFVAVTGPVGSGKTTLRMMIEDYLQKNPNLRLICPETFDMSKVTASAIMREMLEELGEYRLPRSPVSQAKKLKKVIAEKSATERISLMFDEVHRLNEFTLPTLKNFWEMLREGFSRYLGIILLGQPQFESELIKMPEIKERLELLKMPDFQSSAIEYLAHRLRLVGGKIEDLFDDEALDLIARQTATPLALGNVANSALLVAFENEETCVTGEMLMSDAGVKAGFGRNQAKVLSMKKAG